MTTATDFAKQLSRFLSEYLPHERNVSPNTLFAYRDAFVQHIDYMHTRQGVAVERLCLKHLTRQSVLGYLNWIADLTVESVRIDSEPYSIKLYGKGRKARVVPMAREQVEHLRLYMEENHLDNSNMYGTPLFFNNRHEKLTREGGSIRA